MEKLVKESIEDTLKPKPQEDIEKSFKELEVQVRNIPIREDAIFKVAAVLGGEEYDWGYNDVSREIINYLSEKEFYDALIYVLKENIGFELE